MRVGTVIQPGSELDLHQADTQTRDVFRTQRCELTRNLSGGSPRPRHTKKIHFIKNMKQYDTRGSRIVLICAKRSLCAAFSVLPYGESFYLSDPSLNHPRRRHSSGNISTTLEMLPGLEGFHLDTYGRSVSYAQFLYPTNALVRQKPSSASDLTLQIPVSRSTHSIPGRSYPPSRLSSTVGLDLGVEDVMDYDPNLLSDPQWPCGKHKRVLIFASYMTTVIEYVKPSDLKKDMNETFKEKFPHIKLTLSKIRSLKREMRIVGEDCGLQPVTLAMAYVYFEKLVLQGRLNKQNRKLVSAACILLAAKISSDLKKQEVKHLIDKLEERFRISRRELISFEFTILVALEMALYLPESKVMPHFRRLVQQQQV
ncbi:CDK5 and ABL1 enzyme substrate 2-like isoform X1 [Simochromis diagramma]|uniref:CDK5 and ABL1 enzyme substrate 2-like isoform X2 n=1 Tax=Simochromis diagramma TaxID=43689 RepID=UPI001A7E2648|nr:CDK5 and ABL1 enzyme substrate 2-like isoform X2 [Simochromis diagramma]XP_039878539.1 CDK5 and ABL1 enzyme substrate 2-like isoform X1 [Simochromis diagramma]